MKGGSNQVQKHKQKYGWDCAKESKNRDSIFPFEIRTEILQLFTQQFHHLVMHLDMNHQQ